MSLLHGQYDILIYHDWVICNTYAIQYTIAYSRLVSRGPFYYQGLILIPALMNK